MENKKYINMLVDAKNSLYRAIYAGLGDSKFIDRNADFSIIFFRFISSYIHKFKPQQISFFWDAPKSTIWRKEIFNEYKEGREQTRHTEYDVRKILENCSDHIKALSPFINVKTYSHDTEEADDLIYAFCKKSAPRKSLIISSDNDFNQIAFNYRHVDVYNPMQDKFYEPDEFNPVEIKCFKGEKGDNIPGYDGVGPVNAAKLANDVSARLKLFEIAGDDVYIRNAKLIDLSLSPNVLRNCMLIDKMSNQEVKFDINMLYKIIRERNIKGMLGEVTNILVPFKFMS
jgi:5'-3' exonuclease